jgi:putative acetyltransferase
VEIRRERPADHAAVRAVHRAAFAPDGRPEPDVAEAWLVDQLRADAGWLPHLSLVAVSGARVVGHVMASRAVVEPAGEPVLGLGPLGVEPAEQRRGVGSALVHAVLAAAEARDERLVGLLGDPAYYGRFGFVAGAEHGVLPPDPGWGAAFQVRVLAGPVAGGWFRYAEPFDRLG